MKEAGHSKRHVSVVRAAFFGLIVSGVALAVDPQIYTDLSSDESATVFITALGLATPPLLFALVAALVNHFIRRRSK
ncbi:MAG: hypothetical protein ACHQAY_14350 [Hyphomicrobiales bacterium]